MLLCTHTNTKEGKLMEIALVILAAVVLPAAVGWIYGRNGVDPNTVTGKAHYNNSEEK
jgi:hypothetical protein